MPDSDARSVASTSTSNFKMLESRPKPPPSVAGSVASRRSSVSSTASTASFPRFPSFPSNQNPAVRNNSASAAPTDAYSRHRALITDWARFYGGQKIVDSLSAQRASHAPGTTEAEILAENHRFLRDENDDEELESNWGARVAKKYYDRLFKEYALSDLSRYKEGRIALRWRTQAEVISGKGQFECGNIACDEKEGLKSWEVNFGYLEAGEKKNALVKLRLCAECSVKLHWKKDKEREVLERAMEKEKRREEKRRRKESRRQRRRRDEDEGEEIVGDLAKEDQKSRKRRHRDESLDEDPLSDSASDNSSASEEEPPKIPTEPSKVYSSKEASRIWSQPLKKEEERVKTRDEQFEDFFESLFQ